MVWRLAPKDASESSGIASSREQRLVIWSCRVLRKQVPLRWDQNLEVSTDGVDEAEI